MQNHVLVVVLLPDCLLDVPSMPYFHRHSRAINDFSILPLVSFLRFTHSLECTATGLKGEKGSRNLHRLMTAGKKTKVHTKLLLAGRYAGRIFYNNNIAAVLAFNEKLS